METLEEHAKVFAYAMENREYYSAGQVLKSARARGLSETDVIEKASGIIEQEREEKWTES